MQASTTYANNASVTAPEKKAKNMLKDESIYQSVYDAIVEQKLAPGVKLPEDNLAEVFGVSRTIVRKALQRLTHDGLVTNEPKRGSRVALPSAKEGKDVFEARRFIEISALPSVIETVSEIQLADLKKVDEAQISAQRAMDFQKAIRLSGDFHQVLMDVAENGALSAILQNLISRSSLIVAVYGSVRHQLPSCQGHEELLQLVREKDVSQAQQWMGDHLQAIEGTLRFDDAGSDEVNLASIFAQ